ncbi:MAG: hypothetical protein ACRD8W_04945 [Nitrososphaeraceae archaeon]
MRSTSSMGSSLRSPARIYAGPPGAKRIRMKLKMMTPKISGMAWPILETIYPDKDRD